jgi:hypothetical protein
MVTVTVSDETDGLTKYHISVPTLLLVVPPSLVILVEPLVTVETVVVLTLSAQLTPTITMRLLPAGATLATVTDGEAVPELVNTWSKATFSAVFCVLSVIALVFPPHRLPSATAKYLNASVIVASLPSVEAVHDASAVALYQ